LCSAFWYLLYFWIFLSEEDIGRQLIRVRGEGDVWGVWEVEWVYPSFPGIMRCHERLTAHGVGACQVSPSGLMICRRLLG
jgi:hypothetical protein